MIYPHNGWSGGGATPLGQSPQVRAMGGATIHNTSYCLTNPYYVSLSRPLICNNKKFYINFQAIQIKYTTLHSHTNMYFKPFEEWSVIAAVY